MSDDIIKSFLNKNYYFELSKSVLEDNVVNFILELENFPEEVFVQKICDNKNIIELAADNNSKQIVDYLLNSDSYKRYIFNNIHSLIISKNNFINDKIKEIIYSSLIVNESICKNIEDFLKAIFYRNDYELFLLLKEKNILNNELLKSIQFKNVLIFAIKSKFGEEIIFEILPEYLNELQFFFKFIDSFGFVSTRESFYNAECDFILNLDWKYYFNKYGLGSLLSIFLSFEDTMEAGKRISFFKGEVLKYKKSKLISDELSDFLVINFDLLALLTSKPVIIENYVFISDDEVEMLYMIFKKETEMIGTHIQIGFQEANESYILKLKSILENHFLKKELTQNTKNLKVII